MRVVSCSETEGSPCTEAQGKRKAIEISGFVIKDPALAALIPRSVPKHIRARKGAAEVHRIHEAIWYGDTVRKKGIG
jgi:hypothetical protein